MKNMNSEERLKEESYKDFFLFIQTLFPVIEPEERIELRFIKMGLEPRQRFYPDIESIRRDCKHIFSMKEIYNIYIGCCLRMGESGRKENIYNMSCLWVDKDNELNQEEEKFLKEYSPTIEIDSGTFGHKHFFWCLKNYVFVECESKRMKAEAYNKKLAKILNADEKATDLARILRPPQTLNHKGKTEVKLVKCEPSRKYNLEDFNFSKWGSFLENKKIQTTQPKAPWITSFLKDGIGEGQRNDTIFKYACYLRNKGISADIALEQIKLAAKKCDPPLGGEEAARCFQSAYSYEQGEIGSLSIVVDNMSLTVVADKILINVNYYFPLTTIISPETRTKKLPPFLSLPVFSCIIFSVRRTLVIIDF